MGQYNTGFGMSKCLLCEKGTYTDAMSSINCTVCPEDSYSSELGNVALGQCKLCSDFADHTTTNMKVGCTNPVESCICKGQDESDNDGIGYVLAPKGSSELCLQCPVGSICKQNGGTVETLITAKGYWRNNIDSISFYRCELVDMCIGNVSLSENETADKQCYTGHTGPLCSSCLDHYTASQGQLCTKCENGTSYEGITHSIILGGCVYMFLLILLFVCKTKQIERNKKDENEKNKATEEIKQETNKDKNKNAIHHQGTHDKWTRQRTVIYYVAVQERVQILLGFLQINGSLNVSFDVPWPGEFESFLDFSKLANLEISGFSRFNFVDSCKYVVDFITQYYLAMSFLPTILALTSITYIITVIWCKRKTKVHTKDEEKVAYYRAIRLFNLIVFVMYPSLGTRIFLLFYCKNLAGADYLVADNSIKCSGERFLQARSHGIFFLCLYVLGIPLAYLFILYKKRHKLEEQHNIEMFGALYETYEPEFWMWESVEMIKKAFLTGGVLLISPGSSTQILSAIFVLLFYLMLVIRLEPYDDLVDDRLQVLATFATMVNMIIGLLLKLENQSGLMNSNDAIVSLVLVMNIGVVVFMVSQILLPALKYAFKNTRFGKCVFRLEQKLFSFYTECMSYIYLVLVGQDSSDDIDDNNCSEEEESDGENTDTTEMIDDEKDSNNNKSNSVEEEDKIILGETEEYKNDPGESLMASAKNTTIESENEENGDARSLIVPNNLNSTENNVKTVAHNVPSIIVSFEEDEINNIDNSRNEILTKKVPFENTNISKEQVVVPSMTVDLFDLQVQKVANDTHTHHKKHIIKRHRKKIKMMKQFLSKE
jgi:uncharacterized membrane protein